MANEPVNLNSVAQSDHIPGVEQALLDGNTVDTGAVEAFEIHDRDAVGTRTEARATRGKNVFLTLQLTNRLIAPQILCGRMSDRFAGGCPIEGTISDRPRTRDAIQRARVFHSPIRSTAVDKKPPGRAFPISDGSSRSTGDRSGWRIGVGGWVQSTGDRSRGGDTVSGRFTNAAFCLALTDHRIYSEIAIVTPFDSTPPISNERSTASPVAASPGTRAFT